LRDDVVIIEAMAALSWITVALTQQVIAFVFAFSVTPPVAGLHPARTTS
jgi:hypothetical protein